ncbi:MAG TPA: alpha/beta hydrolase [Isosphaeraceae bacterium]|nr:alpha/beta hydrolase [Isosphaeraceae bacterium]
MSGRLLTLLILLTPGLVRADETYTRQPDVIYGRKDGTALTMDVFTPAEPNGAAVILVVSGGFYSSHDAVSPLLAGPLLKRGYTVFAVVHGSQPRYTVPEIVSDIDRSVRFIRSKAAEFGIDPDRIGICGASAGGHLSLMQGTAGTEGKPRSGDPVERASSRVQAVACFFPPTDFLNYGEAGNALVEPEDYGKPFRAAFDFRRRDPETNLWISVEDPEERREILREISPITHVTPDDPPTLIIHGDADPLVPIQQSRTMLEVLKKAGIPTKLVEKPGAGHGWITLPLDMGLLADWFDEHLKKKADGHEKP